MKVILLKDVPRIGRKYEVKEVPDGHAQNFLLPRKLAERATGEALKKLEAQKSKHALEVAESAKAFKAALSEASAAGATVRAEANPEGNLYRAIHADDIVAAFKEKGIHFEERSVFIANPIKQVGVHEIRLEANGHSGVCTITVEAK